jgi:hypothetical protein
VPRKNHERRATPSAGPEKIEHRQKIEEQMQGKSEIRHDSPKLQLRNTSHVAPMQHSSMDEILSMEKGDTKSQNLHREATQAGPNPRRHKTKCKTDFLMKFNKITTDRRRSSHFLTHLIIELKI